MIRRIANSELRIENRELPSVFAIRHSQGSALSAPAAHADHSRALRHNRDCAGRAPRPSCAAGRDSWRRTGAARSHQGDDPMFASFFPNPKPFFLSAVAVDRRLHGRSGTCSPATSASTLSLGWLIGFAYPPPLADGADEAAQAAFDRRAEPRDRHLALPVHDRRRRDLRRRLGAGSRRIAGSGGRWSPPSVILFVVWFQVQLDVMINDWFGTFYDLIQKALATPNSVTHRGVFRAARDLPRHRDGLHHRRRAATPSSSATTSSAGAPR